MSIEKLILIVEDEKDLLEYIRTFLTDAGYVVQVATDGAQALQKIQKHQPDLVILDLGLPVMNGETVCREAKKLCPDMPIIILTARGTTSDIIKGFNLGADDYLAKPFDIEELLVRIKARLKEAGDCDTVSVSDLELNLKTLEARRGKKTIQLTPQEFKFLRYLMENKGRVLTRNMILNRIWMYSPDAETHVVDVYIGYLRKKIDDGFHKKLIHAVRGFGYVMKE